VNLEDQISKNRDGGNRDRDRGRDRDRDRDRDRPARRNNRHPPNERWNQDRERLVFAKKLI